MRFRALVVGACLSVALLPGWARAQTTFEYTVVTEAAPRQQGTVTVSGIRWQCDARACRASGPWPVPGLGACKALAAQVGRIRSYGHPGRQLGATDLQRCNEDLAAPAQNATLPASPPRVRAGLNPTQSRQINLRQQSYLNLARIRERADAEARRRAEQESERRRANSKRGEDCDDLRRDVHPGAAEICDNRDNNCDGIVDEGQTLRRYLDADGDGHGNPERGLDVCPADISGAARAAETTGGGWLVEVGNDCDDQDPARWRDCPRP